MSEPSPYADRVGRAFPGGRYTLEPWRAWLVADAVGDDPWDPDPHPVLAWMASVGGMGLSWDELFEWFDASADDGPVFGEHRTQLHGRLRTGATYDISGEVVSVDRKHGRTAGTFDVVGYRLELRDPAGSGEPVATCENSIVFPRRGA